MPKMVTGNFRIIIFLWLIGKLGIHGKRCQFFFSLCVEVEGEGEVTFTYL
jgi:hypothetical protein